MPCCCSHSQSASKFFSLFAMSYRKRFTKNGFKPSQQQLLTGITKASFKNKNQNQTKIWLTQVLQK